MIETSCCKGLIVVGCWFSSRMLMNMKVWLCDLKRMLHSGSYSCGLQDLRYALSSERQKLAMSWEMQNGGHVSHGKIDQAPHISQSCSPRKGVARSGPHSRLEVGWFTLLRVGLVVVVVIVVVVCFSSSWVFQWLKQGCNMMDQEVVCLFALVFYMGFQVSRQKRWVHASQLLSNCEFVKGAGYLQLSLWIKFGEVISWGRLCLANYSGTYSVHSMQSAASSEGILLQKVAKWLRRSSGLVEWPGEAWANTRSNAIIDDMPSRISES